MFKINIKFIKEECSIFLFIIGHTYKITACAIPLILTIFFMGKNLMDIVWTSDIYIEFANNVFFQSTEHIAINAHKVAIFIIIITMLISAAIMFGSIFTAHQSLLKNYVPKNFLLKKSNKTSNDLKFILYWLLSNTPFNIMIMNSDIPFWLYKVISVYLIQSVIFYVMLKKQYFGYNIIKRSQALTA